MAELKNALTFPIFYHGLVSGRTLFPQYEAVNLIFKGHLTGECPFDEIARPMASCISRGRKAVGYNLVKPIFELSPNDLILRLKKLRLQNMERVVPAFHAFLLARFCLGEEAGRQLKSAYTEADNAKDAYIYIVQVLLCALRYSAQKCPLSKENAQILENLGAQTDTRLFSAREQSGPPNAAFPDVGTENPPPKAELSAIVETMVPRLVHTILSTLYLHEEAEVREFEHIKAAQMGQAAAELLKTGKMTYSEYYKCGNFLEVAKKADLALQRRPRQQSESRQFDFDWFLRFFEAAGSISSEDMQLLWAKVLAGEIENPGNFSLRTIETLRNMTAREALIFKRASGLVLTETDGSKFLFCDTDEDDELNERYGISSSDILLLDECGILSSLQIANHVMFCDDSASGFLTENNLVLLFRREQEDLEFFRYKSYPLTQTALQLLPIVQDGTNNDYLLDLGRALRARFAGKIQITVHNVYGINGDELEIDTECDLLARGH